ncbi:serine/arginine repetitive matrix protein 1 isoform X2 [Helicoverpa zea]|uniref:serine/arginine repetitive matrix protein 1 isoform X2 n=1 Tax=Helicoverpa zea TaxID=7113 RepID=UPI001F578CDC|nr:serine/arginine repetitive matrix protein 1 isoform X2 [Helicoverpa zea]
MSSRRNGSVSRAAEAASKNRLHMDRNPQHSRINDPSNPAGRRKEIDNVMKRARQGSPGSWDRKLLEVEEKDPNRWRHTGYKQLYLEGSRSPSPRRSRSPAVRRSRTPLPSRRSRSPVVRRSRSPVGRRSPRKSRSRSARRSPRRSPIRRSPARSPRRRSPRPQAARRPAARPAAAPARPPPARPARPPSPPDPRKSSGSGSSVSSCSDESCSVCSAKNKKTAPPAKPAKPPPAATTSPSRPRPARAVQPTRELLKAREASKRTREEKVCAPHVLEWQRTQMAVRPVPTTHIKREGERRPGPPAAPPGPPGPAPPRPSRRDPRAVSPAAIAAALNDTDSDSESDASSEPQPQRLTLSERFGKMAQWSADRSARLENMRITRRESTLHVRIERDDAAPQEHVPSTYPALEGAAAGSYPEELLLAAPAGLPSWDDVRVRYDYYKKRGYLRGLTLGDYVKWEEWWYKYQEWLKHERAYERWAEGEVGTVRRERRRRGGRHRRS